MRVNSSQFQFVVLLNPFLSACFRVAWCFHCQDLVMLDAVPTYSIFAEVYQVLPLQWSKFLATTSKTSTLLSVLLDADHYWDYIILMTDECIWSNGLLILTQENKSTWRKAIHISHRVQCRIQHGHPPWQASDQRNLLKLNSLHFSVFLISIQQILYVY